MTEPKRVVLWGTGVVGSMVLAEILDGHPAFELVGVGVSNPDKVGTDAAELCGRAAQSGPSGVLATDSVEELIALEPDAVVHYGPTAQYAEENIRVITAFLRAGIDVCSTAMTPWVWPHMEQTPSNWLDAHRGGVRRGRLVVLHHRHRPGLRQRPVPDDADGPVRPGRLGARVRAARLHRLRG